MKPRQTALRPALARVLAASLFALPLAAASVQEGGWSPAHPRLLTEWGRALDPTNVWPEHPRPQLVREGNWETLNGLWDYALTARAAPRPEAWDGSILVPFAIESALSGVGRRVGAEQALWYRRAFRVESKEGAVQGERTLLHFGAVDWECSVWLDGWQVGTHRGGYTPFSIDVTDALDASRAEHELVVRVWDPSDAGAQPRGKQVEAPSGIWYTPVTGIWQTVWLERVPPVHVTNVRLVPEPERGRVLVTVESNLPGLVLVLARPEGAPPDPRGEHVVGRAPGWSGQALALDLRDPELWSPERPFLYELEVQLQGIGGTPTRDRVRSYCALRSIAVGPDADGIQRLLLNGAPVFQVGPLDQGWWPDGLYTAPSDAALRYDLEVTKRLGFNLIRKHIKVEPARWYRHCDELGLFVWQDFVSGFRTGGEETAGAHPETDGTHWSEGAALVDALECFPSIVMWVPFNEGWGQVDTERTVRWLEARDPTRLVNNASGWTDRGVGDVADVHAYPGPGMPALEPARAAVLGEFGGLGLPVPGHTWLEEGNWGYRSFESAAALNDAYEELLLRTHLLIGKGLAAAVYTQTTDVEIEVNGFLTYDRAVLKLDAARARRAAERLHEPPPRLVPVLPSAQDEASSWRYHLDAPPEGWTAIDFDDTTWSEGQGGFGTEGTPGAIVGTTWSTNAIWLRRAFELDEVPDALSLWLHHDEDVEVHLNGVRAYQAGGWTTDYGLAPLAPQARAALRPGQNVLAITCRQTGGGQFVDAGLMQIESK